MQRVESDRVRTAIGSDIDQGREIGEIAVAPIALRAHAVTLHSNSPDTCFILALEGAPGCDEKRCVFRAIAEIDPQSERADRKVLGHPQLGGVAVTPCADVSTL